MRAVVYAEAIISRFGRNLRMRVPTWWERSANHGTEKGSRPKFADYARERHSYTLTALFLIVTVCLFFACMLDTGWDAMDRRSVSVGSSRIRARPGRALQSSLDVDLEARKKAGALHGMGVTFRTGSRAVSELIVAHLAEVTTAEELRMFLRTLHRSGATARADVVLLFPWSPTKDITRVIDEEERSFQHLMLEKQTTTPSHSRRIGRNVQENEEADGQNSAGSNQERSVQPAAPEIRPFQSSNSTISPFNTKAFWKSREERKVRGEMIWENTTAERNASDEMASLDWADWGSIVGFEMQDLDQGEVLEGFIDNPPAQLRRWTCYPMLLGMMKSKYRTVLLTEVRGVFILRDVLSAARKKAFDSGINLYEVDLSWNDIHKARKKKLSTSISGNRHDVPSSILKNPEETAIPNRKKDGRDQEAGSTFKRNAAQLLEVESRPDVRKIPTGSQEMHFIEEVYGKDVWKSFDKEDKERPALSSGFIMGNIKPVRSLANAMLTEIAALALKRKSRRPFHDGALLNHLVQKSSVLTRRVTDKLHMLSNSEATVHALPGSKQASAFFKENGRGFAALVGLKDELVAEETATAIGRSIRDGICASRADSSAYRDCAL